MPRVLGGFWGDGRFLMAEVPLYRFRAQSAQLTWFDRLLKMAQAFSYGRGTPVRHIRHTGALQESKTPHLSSEDGT